MSSQHKATTAVIFDMDGVLVDSAKAHFRSWRLLGEEVGAVVDSAQVSATFGRHNADIIPLLFGPQQDREVVGRLADRKEALYRDMIRGDVPAVSGAAEVIRMCRARGYRLAVGSSAPLANIELVLEAMGLTAEFACCVSGEDVRHGKPDPEVFLSAAERLQVAPGHCVVIEDAPAGVEAARRAGMRVIGVCGSYAPDALRSADWIVDALDELLELGVPPTTH